MDGDASTGSRNVPDDDFKIKGAAIRTQSTPHSNTETCSICLDSISERAVATPCNHLTFDFLCLVSWLQYRSSCPLCTAEVKEVQYDWRSVDDYKTYRVPRSSAKTTTSQTRRRRTIPRVLSPPVASADPSIERRRHVYRHRQYSLHVGSNRISGYRDFTPAEFARSSELQSKARMFLRRELQIFTFLGNRDFLMEYIVAVFKKYEAKAADGRAVDLLKEFLGETNARQLLHELQDWLRSPFTTLRAWDAEVRYLDSNEAIDKLPN